MTCCASSCAARYSRTWYCRSRARSPDLTSDSSVEVRTGRSITLTFPSRATVSASACDSRPALESTITGRSDHTGWPATQAASSSAPAGSASSETMRRPAPCSCSMHSCEIPEQFLEAMPFAPSTLLMAWASAAVEGSTRTRNSPGFAVVPNGDSAAIERFSDQRVRLANICRYTGEHAVKVLQGLADHDAGFVQVQLADGLLVLAIPLLDHGQCAPDGAGGFAKP